MLESTLFVEGIGIVAELLGLCAWIPQTLDVWVKKKNDGVSLATLSLIITALTLWTIYGFLKGSISHPCEWNRVVYYRIRSIGNHQTPG